MNYNDELKNMLKIMTEEEKNDLYILLKRLTSSREQMQCNQVRTSSHQQ